MADKQHANESISAQPTFQESNFQSLRFMPLHVNGTNFLEWVNDAKTVLSADDLARTLTTDVATTSTDPAQQIPPAARWQALLILRCHLDQPLQLQYMQLDDPAELWTQLHSRFNHQQTLFLPQARTDWINLRVLDFPDFASYNSELHRITAQLRLCGQTITDAELIEKTLSTFPLATAILSQQYRNMKFKKHANLMSHLLPAEKHHQLLLRNVESRPAREIHNTIALLGGPAGAIVPTLGPGSGHRGRDYPTPGAGQLTKVEAHAVEASHRPPKGSYRKPSFKSN